MSGVESAVDEDLDPLAPVLYDGGDAEPELTDAPSPLGMDVEPEVDDAEGDGGVSDGDGIVRVWLEDGQLAKVRVSPNWHAKLNGRPLADAFRFALAMANARVAEVEPAPEPDLSGVDFTPPPLTSRTFAVMQGMFDDVEARWAEATQRYLERPPASHPAVEGRSKGVTVSLDGGGRAERVSFDDKWLDQAQAGSICTHVLQAANNAYGRFQPQADDRSELEAIEEEHAFLMATFKAMLNPKEQ